MRVKSRPLHKSSSFNTDEEIEQDPFGYILSPNLSAGIRNDKSPRLSPFWIKASSSSSSSSSNKNSSAFSSSDRRLVKVKRWIMRIESWYLLRRGGKQDDQISNPAMSSIRIAGDGTRSSTTSTGQVVRGRSGARTSSANREDHTMRPTPGRQHLWRKPSESLWPVLEESEDITP